MGRALGLAAFAATFVLPTAYAWRSWPADRTNLSRFRTSGSFGGLFLTTAAVVGFAGFLLRGQVASHAAWFNLEDWGWNLGRVSLLLSVLALPLVSLGRGRTRLFAILADVWVMLLWLSAFMSA